MDQDLRETGKALLESVTKAWDRLVGQIDEALGWTPTPASGERRPSAMTDGELRAALRAVASALIRAVDPTLQARFPAEGDSRWRFNLPATPQTHVHHMFTEASDAFSLAITGLDRRASSVDLAAVGRLAELLARARWLLEPSDAGQRRARGYALTEETIILLRKASDRADVAGSAGTGLAGEIADRAATMDARLTELRQDDGLEVEHVPKRRKLLQAYLPGDDAELFALFSTADPGQAVALSALFYRESGPGDALYHFQRSPLTRAYWLARAIGLYAGVCAAAGPVLGRDDWKEAVALTEARLRPLAEETGRRYRQQLQRGLHPGL